MYKKIAVSLLLTLIIRAFPVRLLGLPFTAELIAQIIKGLIFISAIFLLLKREKLESIFNFFKYPDKVVLRKLLPAFCGLILYIVLTYRKFLFHFEPSAMLLLLTIISTFVLAFAEEIVFRVYTFVIFRLNGFSAFKSVIISSILFALIHMLNIFRYGDIWSVINQIVFAFFMGILLGSLFVLTKNILITSIMHFIVNLPTALAKLEQPKIVAYTDTAQVTSLAENLVSSIFYILIFSPLIFLSIFYLRLIKGVR